MTALNTFGLRVPSIYVKEGQTLSLPLSVKNDAGAARDLSIATVTCQARTGGDVLVDTGTVTVDDAPAGLVTIEFDTAGWTETNNAQRTYIDVLITEGTALTFTQTLELIVLRSITAHE